MKQTGLLEQPSPCRRRVAVVHPGEQLERNAITQNRSRCQGALSAGAVRQMLARRSRQAGIRHASTEAGFHTLPAPVLPIRDRKN
jgi:hypothetical protein